MKTTGRWPRSSSSMRMSLSMAPVAPEPQKTTTSSRTAVDGLVDDGARLLAQLGRPPPGGRRLGVGVAVHREHLLADEVLDEAPASAPTPWRRRRPCGAGRTGPRGRRRRRSPRCGSARSGRRPCSVGCGRRKGLRRRRQAAGARIVVMPRPSQHALSARCQALSGGARLRPRGAAPRAPRRGPPARSSSARSRRRSRAGCPRACARAKATCLAVATSAAPTF